MSDPVNNPAHYTGHASGVQAIEVTRHLSFNRGNAFKYIFRHRSKGHPEQDLQKALWYVRDEIRNKLFETGIHEYGRRAAVKIIRATPDHWEADCYLALIGGGLSNLCRCEATLRERLGEVVA